MLAFVLVVVFVPASRSEECPAQYLDKPSLVALAHAESVTSLQRVFAGIATPDPAQRLVYAARMQKLQPGGEADNRLIDAIPRYPLDYAFVYSVTFPAVVDDEVLIGICGGGWLEPAALAVLRQHRGMEAFLRLSSFNNADLGEMQAGLNSQLRDKAPKEFRRAMAALPPAARARVTFE